MNTQKQQETPNSGPVYLKAKALATLLGISPKTVFRWAHDHNITAHKMNARVVLFKVSDFMALVQSSRIN